MTGPGRVRLSRRAGWRKPADAIPVTRPGMFGNPFSAAVHGHDGAVALHAAWLDGAGPDQIHAGSRTYSRSKVLAHLHLLTGRPLACWCPLDAPCHGSTLIRLAQETHA